MDNNIKTSVLNSLLFLQENPRVIWSEFDMQTIISLHLMKIPELLPTLVHREYPYTAIKSESKERERAHKFDIVIFSKDDVGNINDPNGYLLVHGENRDGNRIKGEKRAVYCTHLFELKVKRDRFKDGVLKDFQHLREGASYYRNVHPELYSICYFYWNTNKVNIHSEIINSIEKLFTESNKENINFYLLIGPSHVWSKLVSSHTNLIQHINNQTILLLT